MMIAPLLLVTTFIAPLPQSADAQQGQSPVIAGQAVPAVPSGPSGQSSSPVTKKTPATPSGTGMGNTAATNGAPDVVPAAQQAQQPAGGDQGSSSSVLRPHTVGLGGQLGLSTRGGGAGTRLFFGQYVGLDLNVNWIRGLQTTSTGGRPSTFLAVPSVIIMFTPQHPTSEVDLRPYAGAGLSYSSTSQPVQTSPSAASTSFRGGGMGSQVFAGVEATFKDFKSMTISAEVTHYQLPTYISTSTVQNGTNLYVSMHFYLK